MVNIRRAEPSDSGAIAPLFDAYRVFYQQPSDMAAAEEFIRQRLTKEQSVILVADSASGLLGFTQLYPLYSSVQMRDFWILNDLFVDAAARRMGVAGALLTAAEDFARDQGACAIMLETGESNTAAQALYEKQGWQRNRQFFYERRF